MLASAQHKPGRASLQQEKTMLIFSMHWHRQINKKTHGCRTVVSNMFEPEIVPSKKKNSSTAFVNFVYSSMYWLGSDSFNRFLARYVESERRRYGHASVFDDMGFNMIMLNLWSLQQHVGHYRVADSKSYGPVQYRDCLENLWRRLYAAAVALSDDEDCVYYAPADGSGCGCADCDAQHRERQLEHVLRQQAQAEQRQAAARARAAQLEANDGVRGRRRANAAVAAKRRRLCEVQDCSRSASTLACSKCGRSICLQCWAPRGGPVQRVRANAQRRCSDARAVVSCLSPSKRAKH